MSNVWPSSGSSIFRVLMEVPGGGKLCFKPRDAFNIDYRCEEDEWDEKTVYERTGRFPDTLINFGFDFNKYGQLRKIDPKTKKVTDEPFEFNVSDDPDYNQKRYEALGEVLTYYMYDILESRLRLRRLDVPLYEEYLKKTFVYGTDDCLINDDRLLILLQGSGAVRAGMWARSLIINEGLETGSQIPYINKAREHGYSVMVLNPNEGERDFEGRIFTIPHSQTPIEHFTYVWKNYIKTARARYIAIVAHSYGGVVILNAAQTFFSDFNRRVFAIAMTDSAHHSLSAHNLSGRTEKYLLKVSRNWIADSSPLDTPIHTAANEIPRVSAGHTSHCMTSNSAISSVFTFLGERYEKTTGKPEVRVPTV
ncbi:FAM172 family protein homolog CG10038 isoform X2 [Anabrus simplex]|uniref:FAM172 family protein homolog CG10038 isoform X2 n=1 Tax=Anabrus simplex TaxID=316456 RepID=UPI0035A37057